MCSIMKRTGRRAAVKGRVKLLGAPVYGPGDEKVGSIGELSLQKVGEIRTAIIDVGGFLGIGAKHVAVPFETLHFFLAGVTCPIHAHIHGIICARAAGCHAIGFIGPSDHRPDHEARLRAAGAHDVVHGAGALLDLLETVIDRPSMRRHNVPSM